MQLLFIFVILFLIVFVSFIQRAANTGWGREEDKPKWGHDKFEGPKKERRSGNNQSNHIPETRDRDSRTRARNFDAELDNQPKKSDRRETAKRWHDNNDDKFEGRENNSRREENRSRYAYQVGLCL